MDLKKLKKIQDTTLKSGVITFGNLNDQVNCIMKCAPNLPSETVDEIFTALQGLGVNEGDKLVYELTDQHDDSHIFEFPVGTMMIAFTKIV